MSTHERLKPSIHIDFSTWSGGSWSQGYSLKLESTVGIDYCSRLFAVLYGTNMSFSITTFAKFAILRGLTALFALHCSNLIPYDNVNVLLVVILFEAVGSSAVNILFGSKATPRSEVLMLLTSPVELQSFLM